MFNKMTYYKVNRNYKDVISYRVKRHMLNDKFHRKREFVCISVEKKKT